MNRLLSELLPDLDISKDITIQGISDDSRRVKAGDLFIAVPGLNFDAREEIPQVALKSVAAICCDAPSPYPRDNVKVPLYEIKHLSQQKGLIASRFYGFPSKHLLLIAVTGTNGKTSCSQFVAEALTRLKRPCAVVGTLGYGMAGALKPTNLTTPDAIRLQAILNELVDDECDAVCLEASSHGLAQGRLNGTDIDVAVFTNITRDHLDYHHGFADYKRAKAKLFTWPGLKAAVINMDDAFSEELTGLLGPDAKLLRYSLQDARADIYCASLTYHPRGIEATVNTPWGNLQLSAAILGDFNLSNLMAVIGILGSLGYSSQQIEAALNKITAIHGRMEVINRDVGPIVVIDYAHTPDALEKAIRAIKLHSPADIWTLMGCGGDRDRGKRPIMGEIGARLSEHLLITDDNPRFEDSASIIKDILAGDFSHHNVMIEADREKAITYAITHARADDIILLAGKGHETYQDVVGERRNYSDHQMVEAVLQSMVHAAKRPRVIIGLGKSGYSCAQYFKRQHIPFSIMDDAAQPAYLSRLNKTIPGVKVSKIDAAALLQAGEIVLSPGVPLVLAPVQGAIAAGIAVTGDIALFAKLAKRPLIAITGSNGKTTVTDLLGFMLRKAGMNPGVGGNIGTPCLGLLAHDHDSYIIEVSSYQLEVVQRLNADIAVVLNLAPDHLNRYDTPDDYYAVKLKIYAGCKIAILNRALNLQERPESSRLLGQKSYSFGTDEPLHQRALGLRLQDGKYYLARGNTNLMAANDLAIKGRHNWQNALAALAIGAAFGLSEQTMVNALVAYPGLPHRCEWLGQHKGVDCYNDSKSTNPASTLAGVLGLARKEGHLHLIMGGDAKGADFRNLQHVCHEHVKAVYLFGKDRKRIKAHLGATLASSIQSFQHLGDLVHSLSGQLAAGDQLLFSPGCASFDQFDNFEQRGITFKSLLAEVFP